MSPEYKLTDKSVTSVVLKVKIVPSAPNLGPYSNYGPLSMNLASELFPVSKLTDMSVIHIVLE